MSDEPSPLLVRFVRFEHDDLVRVHAGEVPPLVLVGVPHDLVKQKVSKPALDGVKLEMGIAYVVLACAVPVAEVELEEVIGLAGGHVAHCQRLLLDFVKW